jgi:hypothetical protein
LSNYNISPVKKGEKNNDRKIISENQEKIIPKTYLLFPKEKL